MIPGFFFQTEGNYDRQLVHIVCERCVRCTHRFKVHRQGGNSTV